MSQAEICKRDVCLWIEPIEEVEVVEEVETPEVVEIIEEEKEFEVDNTKRIETLLKYINPHLLKSFSLW